MKIISILGASGSIGQQALDVVSQHTDLLKVYGISIYSNETWLETHLKDHHYDLVVVKNYESVMKFKGLFPTQEFDCGQMGLTRLATHPSIELVVNALVGFSGLVPSIKAAEANKDLALANKESLVVAGERLMELVHLNKIQLIPIDSEHSALAQAMIGHSVKDVSKLIITASGGSFRHLSREQLKSVTVEDALKHPNWSMGAKITIDSATMVNKAFEVIEAHWLFNLAYSKIEAIIHPQSIIHGMVEFIDGSIMAHLASADMRIPIQYALLDQARISNETQKLNLLELKTLSFEPLDEMKHPLFKLCISEAQKGKDRMLVINAANEAAIKRFLNHEITYLEIETMIEDALKHFEIQPLGSIQDMIELDQKVRDYVHND